MADLIKNTDLDFSKALIFDAHLLKTFRACEEKYRLFNEEHVVSNFSSAAPAFGIAMHEGIAKYREEKRDGKTYEQAMKAGQLTLLEAYKKHMPPEMKSEIMEDAKRGPRNALRLFEGYCKHYEPMGFKWLHVEVPFALYLGKAQTPMLDITGKIYDMRDVEVIYVGIIDGVHEYQGRMVTNDIKTTGWSINESFLDGFRLDQGLLGYTIAVRELLGIDTHYATIHAIWVQGEPKSGKGKPLDEYFATKEIYWDDEQMAEWTQNTLSTIEDIQMKKATGKWVRDWGQNCGAFGGCSYRPICWTTPNFREQIIKNDFKRAIWTPLEDERLQEIE